MPPPRFQVFKTHGSQDDNLVEISGYEVFDILSFYKDKWMLYVSAFFSILAGAMPILMNLTIGNIATVMTQSTSFLDSMLDLTKRMIYIVVSMLFVMSITMGLRVLANPSFAYDLRAVIYSTLMELQIDYFDKASTGVLISRL